MGEKLFALSEDTKDKVLELIGRKPAPDKYATKAPVMREYYSRMWIVALQNDIPPMGGKNWCHNVAGNNTHKVYFSPAWILERVDVDGKNYSVIQKRVWKGDYVVIDKVYNPINRWARAYDNQGRFIVYYAVKDMFGTVWIWRPSTWSKHGSCGSFSSSSSSSESWSGSNGSDSFGL